jgi:hypothetical protein
VDEITGHVSAHDTDMLQALRERGVEPLRAAYPGRVRILRFEAMMAKLMPVLLRRGLPPGTTFSRRGDRYLVESRGACLVEADDRTIHDVVFGSVSNEPSLPAELRGAFPLPLVYPLDLNVI